MSFLNTILSYIFGDRCLLCKAEGEVLCQECLGGFSESQAPTFPWIFPLYDFRHLSMKKTIHMLKYKGRSQIAEILGKAMHARIMEELADLKSLEYFTSPLLIPIPLSKKRYRKRGYNQAGLLAQELAKISKLSNEDLTIETTCLIKTKETEHQANIVDRSTRLKNISDTFAVSHKEKIKNKNIILIDDVTTTGATLLEAKKILEEAGASRVIAFTVAH